MATLSYNRDPIQNEVLNALQNAYNRIGNAASRFSEVCYMEGFEGEHQDTVTRYEFGYIQDDINSFKNWLSNANSRIQNDYNSIKANTDVLPETDLSVRNQKLG